MLFIPSFSSGLTEQADLGNFGLLIIFYTEDFTEFADQVTEIKVIGKVRILPLNFSQSSGIFKYFLLNASFPMESFSHVLKFKEQIRKYLLCVSDLEMRDKILI